MRIRDALESDAEALAELSGRPVGVMVDTIHDRSVRVAVPDGDIEVHDDAAGPRAGSGTTSDGTGSAGSTSHGRTPIGYIAFDVRTNTVYITGFAGPDDVIDGLFAEPRRFAVREGMSVGVVVSDDDTERVSAVRSAGFEHVGSGPRFDGHPTSRYRLDPSEPPSR